MDAQRRPPDSTPPTPRAASHHPQSSRAGTDDAPPPRPAGRAAESQAIELYVRSLWQRGDVREVRIPKADGYRTHAGYFDDPAALANAVSRWDGRANVYVTINPVNPALMARASNRIIKLDTTTSDRDILARCWLPIDIDSKRPAGISATDVEVEAARDAARRIVSYLEGMSWGHPVVSLSGNGYQLLYPVDLPNDQDSTGLVAGILGHLGQRFNSEVVTIDPTVSNAARIMALIGTMKVKGDATPDRPHRRSELISAPDQLMPIDHTTLVALLPEAAKTTAVTTIDRDGVDPGWVRRLLDDAEIPYREQAPDAAGIVWYGLERCPYHPDDGTPWQCGVGEAPDGAGTGKCFHDRGRGKGWQDFRRDLKLPPKAKKKTDGEHLREAVDEAGVEFFHDAEFRTYAAFEQGDHREVWPVRSSGFRRYVAWLMYQRTHKAPRAAVVSDFIALVEGRAQFDGKEHAVHVRIAPTDDGIALDLGDPEWTVIEVDAVGWRRVNRSDVHFIRPRGMLPLPVPVRGGSIKLLGKFVNVTADAWLLLVGFLVMMFRPAGPFPVLGVHGEQGAAKSTLMRILRWLVDPRQTMDRAAPRNEHDLAIHAMHNWVIALDNLSSLPEWLSDALARLATGAGFGARELYSDSDEFSFSAARPIMLNGIGEVIQRSDLLDRAVIIELAPIPETKRRLEADFWADFDEARPHILGALLDAVSVAIKRESTVTMARWPRMADFARWVTAAEPGLGWEDGSFLRAYYANRGSAHEMALDADPVATAVRDLMASASEWEGRPTELLGALEARVGESVSRRKDWPAGANTLSNRLRRLAPNLRTVGIEVEWGRRGTRRTIRLSSRRESSSPSSPSSSASADEARTGDDAPSSEPLRATQDRHPSSPADGNLAHVGNGCDDGDGPPQWPDEAVPWDPEAATDDDADLPICECGHLKVATPTGRWVCTYAPGHPSPFLGGRAAEPIQ